MKSFEQLEIIADALERHFSGEDGITPEDGAKIVADLRNIAETDRDAYWHAKDYD